MFNSFVYDPFCAINICAIIYKPIKGISREISCHKCTMGTVVVRDVFFLHRRTKLGNSCILIPVINRHGPFTHVCCRNGLQSWGTNNEWVGYLQNFGINNWNELIGGPYGMCNGHYQLFKHTPIIFKLSPICHHIVQLHEIKLSFPRYE
jgi:hypothetical protein